MKKALSCLLATSMLVCCGMATDVKYRQLGTIKTTNPAFVSIEQFPGQDPFMLVSSFGEFVSGSVYVIPGITDIVKQKKFDNVQAKTISADFTWPNKIETVPQAVFGKGVNAISVPDGFLPPGHTNGGIYIITTDSNDFTKKTGEYKISQKKNGYFYHMGLWYDVNNDGRYDYVTARSNAKSGGGELIWLEHPENGLAGAPW
jgi:hypothetical protein